MIDLLALSMRGAKLARVEAAPARDLRLQMLAGQVPDPTVEHRFDLERAWRFDFAWPSLMVAVEVDGGTRSNGRHVRAAGFEADADKLNRAALLGWRVLRFTSAMVADGRAIRTISELHGLPVRQLPEALRQTARSRKQTKGS
jgi:very-short-patch-repair endonuclease